jgi:PleD family two-component response regulator
VREITQDTEPEALVAEADAAMYLRKRDRKTA